MSYSRRWFHFSILATIWCCAFSAAGFDFFEPVQPPRRYQVMVHRGEARQAPENTRPALDRCIEDGLEWAEIDLRLTKDGQHILSHDASVPAPGGETWKIAEHTLEELEKLDVGSTFAARYAGERLLPFRDCLKLCKGRLNLYLDCKAISPEQLAREILEAGMEKQVVVFAGLEQLRLVQSTSKGRVATMAKWRPGLDAPGFAVTNQLAAVEIDA